jgi:hypothetical protein
MRLFYRYETGLGLNDMSKQHEKEDDILGVKNSESPAALPDGGEKAQDFV